MEEPKRLFESGTALERSILESTRDDTPPEELERRVLAAMTVASVMPPLPVRTSLLRPRAVVVGITTIALGLVVARGVLRGPPPPLPPAPASIAPAPPTQTAPAEPAKEPEEATLRPSDLPNAATPASQVPSALRAGPAPPSASIEREVELLDAVKAKLGAGETAGASSTLDTYDSEFREGTLRPEATVLRVRTLLARGERAMAEKVGADYLSKHSTGVHAKRIRALLDK